MLFNMKIKSIGPRKHGFEGEGCNTYSYTKTYVKKTLARKKLLGGSVAVSKIQQFKELTFYLVSLLFSHSLCAE